MSGDVQVRICERLGVQLPRATRPIVHCRTEKQAQMIRKAIAKRLLDCGLELHPEKTRIVYCKDDCGREDTPMRSSIFLAMNSVQGSRSIATEKSSPISVPRSRPKLPRRCGQPSGTGGCGTAVISLWKICPASTIRFIRGWFQYYGRYYRTGLYSVIRQLDQELVNWARQKYKKLRNHVRRARRWVAAVSRRSPHLFAPWATMRGGSLMGAV